MSLWGEPVQSIQVRECLDDSDQVTNLSIVQLKCCLVALPQLFFFFFLTDLLNYYFCFNVYNYCSEQGVPVQSTMDACTSFIRMQPDDAEGWQMVGIIYTAMMMFDEVR